METIEPSADTSASRQSRITGLIALGVFALAGILITLLPKTATTQDTASIQATNLQAGALVPVTEPVTLGAAKAATP